MSHQQQPSVWDKLQMGLIMGGSVGATMGLVMGTFTVLVYGPGPNGYLRTIGANMLKSGGFFASLMSVGSLIRSESDNNLEFYNQRRLRALKTLPIVISPLERQRELEFLLKSEK